MKVKDRDFDIFISEKELAGIVRSVAEKVNADYEPDGGSPLLVCPVLTGAFMPPTW